MMSRERRVSKVALVALIAVCGILLILSLGCAGDGEDNPAILTEELMDAQDANGSWNNGIVVTTQAMYGLSLKSNNLTYKAAFGATNWTMANYESNILYSHGEGQLSGYNIKFSSFILLTDSEVDGFSDFKDKVADDIVSNQSPNGDYLDDAGVTALATYGLSRAGAHEENLERGVDWLLENEDKENRTWGSISDDSKAILALDSAKIDMWEEIAALMLKQRPDGSFGGIEETSWAVCAMSTHLNEQTMERMQWAMAWLLKQEYHNNEDLANAAMAEQYYLNSLDSWDSPQNDMPQKGGGAGGFLPPPIMYLLSIFIISAIILGYFLFARIERDAALSGIRKDIFTYISEHPGEHLAQITKRFNISSSNARYHLSVLEGMDQIVSHKNGKFKRFYINANGYSKFTNGNGYKPVMSALKNATARRMVKFLLGHPNANQKSVSCALDLHPSTVNWHAKRLGDAEVLSKSKKGKEIVYNLNEDVQVRKVIGILEGVPA